MRIFSREVRSWWREKREEGEKVKKKRSKEACDEEGELIGVWI
jgi:hypothetical protein